ncbi:MAG: efflux RND transporter periplasmic adaptor subunit [Rhizobacter sp.]|nr:efflux RND transporter periplasmic adaptor subunit [Ferruginibacter sp.]
MIKQIAIAFLILAFTACGKKTAQAPPPAGPVAVTTTVVTESNAVYYDEYPATLVPLNQSEIRPQVTGYITGVHFTDGAKVSKGQKLYSIDQQLYQANYQAAAAAVRVQQTQLAKAQKDAERYRQLDKEDAIAKQQVDYAEAALAAAKSQVSAAQASANAVRANVRFATIYAPFSGTIGISQARLGTSVVAGQSVLNTISTDNPMSVDFTVDQKEIFRFTQLQTSKSLNDSTFSLAFGNDVYPFYGKINIIDRAVDPQTGSIKVRLSFPNDKQMLKAGMSGTVRILNNNTATTVIIPHKAITEQLGEFYVYVVGDSNKVTQRKLVLGKQLESNIIVKVGLKPGEKIVVQGVQNLKEGAVITTDTAQAPAAQPAKK